MTISINGYTVDIKAKYGECTDRRMNKEDTMSVLNLISLADLEFNVRSVYLFHSVTGESEIHWAVCLSCCSYELACLVVISRHHDGDIRNGSEDSHVLDSLVRSSIVGRCESAV